MTAKDKAEQLVDKMYMPENIYQGHELAKQCAIIAVDEIIKAKTKILDKGDGWQLVESNIYWQEVKQEIENL